MFSCHQLRLPRPPTCSSSSHIATSRLNSIIVLALSKKRCFNICSLSVGDSPLDLP
jgi:hypothetical protein